MKILAALRSLRGQIIELQNNQKEKENSGTIAASGMALTPPDPIQQIGMLEMEIEGLYNQLIDTQSKLIKTYESNY